MHILRWALRRESGGPSRLWFNKTAALHAATNGGDYRDGGVGAEGSGQAAGVADRFVADEDIDVFAELAFFGEKAVAQSWVSGSEELQSFKKRGGRSRELNFSTLLRKIAKRTGDMYGNAHLLFPDGLPGRRLVFIAEDLERLATDGAFVRGLAEA